MSQDLQQYADIIEQLKPTVNTPDFNKVLLQVAGGLPKEKRFLIKMEVKRLAKPCVRSIDLRGLVEGECKLYQSGGISHYMDEVAVETFEQQMKIFGGYTFGVYEAVQNTENNFRVMRDKAIAREKYEEEHADEIKASQVLDQFKISTVNLLDYRQRKTERMNFAVAVELFNENKKSMRGISVDISLEGLQVKLTKDFPFKDGELLYCYFRGLEEEFAMDKTNGIAYRLVKITEKKDIVYLALQRAEDFPNPAFDKFLESFIHGNKRRYKVNMTNTIEAIVSKMCEQFFSPRSPTLPVYIDEIEGQLVPRFAMVNEVNRETMNYWQDEEDECRLGYLLNNKRLTQLLVKPESRRETFLFSFTHLQQDKVYFYSASVEELQKKDILKRIFLGFGSRKASWRAYKLTITEASSDQAYTPLSIPDSAGEKIKRQNSPPPARLLSKLKHLKYLAHLTDVTSVFGQQTYSQMPFSRDKLSYLRVFGHARNHPPVNIKQFRFKHQEQRLESRYRLRSQIELKIAGSNDVFNGISEDISVHGLGLRIELTKEFEGELNGHVEIAFPKLQKITKSFDVLHLHYIVIYHNVEKNILHLKAVPGDLGKSARLFFEELIKKNKNALEAQPEDEEIPGMGHALRCINARNATSLSFLMSKEGVRYSPQACITGKQDQRITRLAEQDVDDRKVNLEFMFRDRKLDTPFMQSGLKQIKVEKMPLRQELFVSFDPTKKDPRRAILPRFSNRFETDEQRKLFIEEAINRGQFVAIHVMLVTTGKPDLDMIQTEFNYVSMYAIHKAKELEEKLWSLAACAHLIDVTDEVLLRYGFDNDVVLANHDIDAKMKGAKSGIQALLQA